MLLLVWPHSFMHRLNRWLVHFLWRLSVTVVSFLRENAPNFGTFRFTWYANRPNVTAVQFSRSIKFLRFDCLLINVYRWGCNSFPYHCPVFSRLYNGRAYATGLRLSVCLSVVCIRNVLSLVDQRCILEQKLLLTAYRKSYMRNWLVYARHDRPAEWPSLSGGSTLGPGGTGPQILPRPPKFCQGNVGLTLPHAMMSIVCDGNCLNVK